MKNGDNETLQLFVEESREHLDGIEEDLLAIEQGGENAPEELVDKVFRAVHTIKGSAGFFSFEKIKKLSHAMENVLGKIRAHEMIPVPAIITVLLDGADALRCMINDLDNSEETEITSFVQKLESFLEPSSGTPNGTDSELLSFACPVSGFQFDVDPGDIYKAQQTGGGRFVFLIELDSESDAFAKDRSEEDLLSELGEIVRIIGKKRPSGLHLQKYLIIMCVAGIGRDVLVEFLTVPPERVCQVLAGKVQKNARGQYSIAEMKASNLLDRADVQKENKGVQTLQGDSASVSKTENSSATQYTRKNSSASAQESSLRVNLHTLDKLMTLAGEMVLTRNELLQNASAKNMQKIQTASQRVDSITSELQEAIMSTRMQSIGVVFGKFRRVVRDLSNQLGKQVRLEIEGEDVELDKSIIEAIGDPLTHIVRNAVDHGIEFPEERQRLGKQPQGSLEIKARHEAGHVVIQIADDGKGIDPAVIRKKARKLDFVDESTLSSMSDREVVKLIFKPGFSTAEKVSEISGRGVGMDVVISNLKKVGGAVDIDSLPGEGTNLRIKLPLTLAIIPSLLVIVEGERYALPQANLVELVRIPAADVKKRVEKVGGAAVMRLRGELLPLVRVSDVLGIAKTFTDTESGKCIVDRRENIADRRTVSESETADDERRRVKDRRKSHLSAVNVVVVAAGDFKYGLIVDSLLDSSEIVVKPLGYHLSECREYAGATILGDGQVALILDVVGIRRVLEMKADTEAVSQRNAKGACTIVEKKDKQSFLIVENGDEDFFAIPIGLVARIEKFKEEAIRKTGGKLAVKYRGGSLRLFSIEDAADVKPRKKGTNAYIVIFQLAGREVGIICSEIVDTVDISACQIDDATHVQSGIIGSALIRDSITLIVDLFGLVEKCAPELSKVKDIVQGTECRGRVLLVEDSPFFLQQIRSFMEDAGYQVVCAQDGVKGLAVLKNSSETIDLVLTDIEMPNMNGLELTRAIRSDQKLQNLPVIAITSVSGERAELLGREAGVDEYLIKLERDAVLAACGRYLSKRVNSKKELV
ncbi:MAG: chemotaxis protein CheW [Chitinispirillaceae bacterium]